MCVGVPAPTQTRLCWSSVRSISAATTSRRGNGATPPGSKPVASTTSSARAMRASRAPSSRATFRCSTRRSPGTSARTYAPSQTRTSDLTICSSLQPAARAASSALGVPSGNSSIVASTACARSTAATRSTGSGSSDGDALLIRLERARHGDAALDVGAELAERQLDRRERRGDVEHVEPADVADPEDLPLQAALPGRQRDAVAVAQVAEELGAVDAVGDAHRGDDRRGVVVGREELEPHRLHPGPGGPPEPHVLFEARLEPGVEQHPEGDVEPLDQRDGRRERGVEHLLRLPRAPPVEVERARRGEAVEEALGDARRGEARRAHQRLLRAADDDVDPQASVSSGTAPSEEIASTTSTASPTAAFSAWTSLTTPVEVSEWVQKTTRA